MGTEGGKKMALKKNGGGRKGGQYRRDTVCGRLTSKVWKDEVSQQFRYSAFPRGSGIPACPCFTLETVFVQLQPCFTAFSGVPTHGGLGVYWVPPLSGADIRGAAVSKVLLINLLQPHLFPQGDVCKRHLQLVTNKL